jgi:hypothetical protein
MVTAGTYAETVCDNELLEGPRSAIDQLGHVRNPALQHVGMTYTSNNDIAMIAGVLC